MAFKCSHVRLVRCTSNCPSLTSHSSHPYILHTHRRNELGNLHVSLDNLELAAEYYESALHHGMELAELNIAIVRYCVNTARWHSMQLG